MRQTPLERKTGLRRTGKPKRGRGFAASLAQRAAVAGKACIVCGRSPCDPAHLCSRVQGGCDDEACVVPLCRDCHRTFDERGIDLLSYVDHRHQAHAVFHLGIEGARRRLAPSVYRQERAA